MKSAVLVLCVVFCLGGVAFGQENVPIYPPGYAPAQATVPVAPVYPQPPFVPHRDSTAEILAVAPNGVEKQSSDVHTETLRPLAPAYAPYQNAGYYPNYQNYQPGYQPVQPVYQAPAYPAYQPVYQPPCQTVCQPTYQPNYNGCYNPCCRQTCQPVYCYPSSGYRQWRFFWED